MNTISFTISAVDKATEIVTKITDQIEKMTEPFEKLSKAAERFAKVSGLEKLGKSIESVTGKAVKLGKSLMWIATPLLALIGGGTIAGIYELAAGWAKVGAETERTAQIMGMSAQSLMGWRGAGELVGISADAMTTSMRSFADTLQDARWGRNQEVMGTLQMLGIHLKKTKTGAIDFEDTLVTLADKIQKIQQVDPGAARHLASMFGVSELLPVLIKGGAALKAYQQESARLMGITPEMTSRAADFAVKLNKMKLGFEGTKAAIADKLIPIFDPLIAKWTEFLTPGNANHTHLIEKIEEVAKKLEKWLANIDWDKTLNSILKFVDDCVKLVTWIDKTVDSLGGWKTILIGLGVYMGGSFALSMLGVIGNFVALGSQIGATTALVNVLFSRFSLLTALIAANAYLWTHPEIGEGIGDWVYDVTHPDTSFSNVPNADTDSNSNARHIGSDKNAKIQKLYAAYAAAGFTKDQSTGMIANFMAESQLEENVSGDGGRSVGLGQWNGPRRAAFKNQYGHDLTQATFDEEVAFSIDELTKGAYKAVGDHLKKTVGRIQASDLVMAEYESPDPNNRAHDTLVRRAFANTLYAGNYSDAPVPSIFPNKTSDPMFNAGFGLSGAQDAPDINLVVHTTVHKDGSTTTMTQTPTKTKIAHTVPDLAYGY